MLPHKYLCLVSHKDQGDAVIDPRQMARFFHHGMPAYRYHLKKMLPDGSVITIFKIRLIFVDIPNALKLTVEYFNLAGALIIDPATKAIQSTPVQNWDTYELALSRIRSEPALV